MTPISHRQSRDPWDRELESLIRHALESIRFGTLTLVVQDGRVIQIEKNEKIRLNRQGNMDGDGI